jgi:hypothetical protein
LPVIESFQKEGKKKKTTHAPEQVSCLILSVPFTFSGTKQNQETKKGN